MGKQRRPFKMGGLNCMKIIQIKLMKETYFSIVDSQGDENFFF